MKIQANHSGTRTIEVTEQHLQTLEKYELLRNLVDSNGIIDEAVLDKLKYNVRALLEGENTNDKNLLDLCLDVIYNQNMKAFGLNQLISCYEKWQSERPKQEEENQEAE